MSPLMDQKSSSNVTALGQEDHPNSHKYKAESSAASNQLNSDDESDEIYIGGIKKSSAVSKDTDDEALVMEITRNTIN